jgi:hypothetical protein
MGKYYFNVKNPQYLKLTNNLLILSFIFFILNSKKNINEILLSICLIITFLTSQLFWNNPIRYSIIHKLDGFIAKISIIYFLIYTIFYKKLNNYLLYSYLFFMLCALIFFYLSDYYSNIEWCGAIHIYYHSISHIFCFIGSLYSFL